MKQWEFLNNEGKQHYKILIIIIWICELHDNLTNVVRLKIFFF